MVKFCIPIFTALQLLNIVIIASQCSDHHVKPSDLSRFGKAVYKLLIDSPGDFEKLYNLHLTPQEAKEQFYEAGKYLMDQTGVLDHETMVQDMADAIESLYATGDVDPLDFMFILDNTVESYMAKKGLNMDNAKLFAHVYHDVLETSMKSVGPIDNSRKALRVLAMGSERILKLLSTNLADDMPYLFKVFTETTKKVVKQKSE